MSMLVDGTLECKVCILGKGGSCECIKQKLGNRHTSHSCRFLQKFIVLKFHFYLMHSNNFMYYIII